MARRRRKQEATGGLFDAAAPAPDAASPAEPSTEASGAGARPSGPQRFTVSELTDRIRAHLEGLGRIAVEGEISGCKRASSGHVYFDLKDGAARLSCVVWRRKARAAFAVDPEEGQQVLVTGKLDVYGPRGSYSLIAERVEPVGIGARLAELEALKRELGELGWFERSRPLPRLPRLVGIVTSRDGAALRDFLRTRTLRFPGYPVRLAHAPVQGPGAAQEIARAIDRLDASGVEVLVVARGGGSLEDLWAFNERPVAEAIHRASVPVVTGVGHETDTTLADLVADHRAHTPTDAAQAVLPDRGALLEAIRRGAAHLGQAIDRALEARLARLTGLARRPALRRPERLLEQRARLLGDRRARMEAALGLRLAGARERLVTLEHRLAREGPRSRLERWSTRLERGTRRLAGAAERFLEGRSHRFGLAAGTLESLSPLAVLARGYSVTTRAGGGAPLTDTEGIVPGDQLVTRLARGTLWTRVERLEADPSPGQEHSERG